MSANVETMMYVQKTTRDIPWHGLGTSVSEAPNSEEALRLAGLDWRVESKPIQLCGGSKIPGYYANVRGTDNKVLGVVGDRYKIFQNTDAFSVTDGLLGEGCVYETAGSLNGGKRIWLLAKAEQFKLAGDETDNYLCFTNTHDGSGSVKVCITPVRVVCNNTLNLALQSAKRSFAMRHTTNVDKKIDEAREVLGLAAHYTAELAEYAEFLVKKEVDDFQVKSILNALFPVTEKSTELQKRRAGESKEAFYVCYAMPDIAKFQGTAWGVVNAVSDLVAHSLPHKNTQNYQENNWGRIMDGAPLLDKVVSIIG